MCGIAGKAVTTVADRALAKDVEHRAFPAGSLGEVDPCDSVSAATVGRVPGLAGAVAKPYPAAHQCRWSKDGTLSLPRMRVLYSIGTPSEPDGRNISREDLGGRSTAISKSNGASSVVLCAAETTHIPFEGGAGLSELATVIVSLPAGSQSDQACAAARAVAAEVWSGLPE
jgi:hypothetical protein